MIGSDEPYARGSVTRAPARLPAASDGVEMHFAERLRRKRIFLALADMVEALWFGYVPVVCDISGPALAGGAVLAATADFAIVDTHAGKVCFSEVKVGLPLPRFIQMLVHRRVIAPSWSDVMLLGRNMDADQCVRVGFATQTYTGATDREEAMNALIGRITRLSSDVLRESLRQGRAADLGLIPAFREDMNTFADFLTDEFLGKGLKAVVKGESPRF